MKVPSLDFEITESQKAILIVVCPECGYKSRFLFDEVSPGTPILCNCGGVLNLSDDGLKSIQQKLDNIKKT